MKIGVTSQPVYEQTDEQRERPGVPRVPVEDRVAPVPYVPHLALLHLW